MKALIYSRILLCKAGIKYVIQVIFGYQGIKIMYNCFRHQVRSGLRQFLGSPGIQQPDFT